MSAIDPVEVAENANTYTPLNPGDERLETGRYVLYLGRRSSPHATVVQRLRLRDDEVEEVRAEVHELLRERGRTACTWEIGTHATPAGLVDRLLALGAASRLTPRPSANRPGATICFLTDPWGNLIEILDRPEERA